jgi:hypothetical protein
LVASLHYRIPNDAKKKNTAYEKDKPDFDSS